MTENETSKGNCNYELVSLINPSGIENVIESLKENERFEFTVTDVRYYTKEAHPPPFRGSELPVDFLYKSELSIFVENLDDGREVREIISGALKNLHYGDAMYFLRPIEEVIWIN